MTVIETIIDDLIEKNTLSLKYFDDGSWGYDYRPAYYFWAATGIFIAIYYGVQLIGKRSLRLMTILIVLYICSVVGISFIYFPVSYIVLFPGAVIVAIAVHTRRNFV